MPVWYRPEPNKYGDAVQIFRGTVWEMAEKLDRCRVALAHIALDDLEDSASDIANEALDHPTTEYLWEIADEHESDACPYCGEPLYEPIRYGMHKHCSESERAEELRDKGKDGG